MQRFQEGEHGHHQEDAILLGGSYQGHLGSNSGASHHEDEQPRQQRKPSPPAPLTPAPLPPPHGSRAELDTCRLVAALRAEGLNAFLVNPRTQRPQDVHARPAQVRGVCGTVGRGQRGCGEAHPYGESPACWRSHQPYLLVLPPRGSGLAGSGAAAAGGVGGTTVRAPHAGSSSSSPITQGIHIPVGDPRAAALAAVQLQCSTTPAPVEERTAHGMEGDDGWACSSEAAPGSAGAVTQLQPLLPLTPPGPQRGPMRPSPAACPCCQAHLPLGAAAAATTGASRMAPLLLSGGPPPAAPDVVVVEPALRAMFTAVPATAEYKATLEQLPEVRRIV